MLQPESHCGRIFRLWGLIEFLEPFALKSIADSQTPTRIVKWYQHGEKTPWSRPFRQQRPNFNNRRIKHTVYFGVHDYGLITQSMLEALNVELRPTPNDGAPIISCLGAFTVSEDGLPDDQSLQLTTAPWLLGRARAIGTFELAGWSGAFRKYHEASREALSVLRHQIEADSVSTQQLTGECLAHFAQSVLNSSRSGIPIGLLAHESVRDYLVVSTTASSSSDEKDDILGSFYINDLEAIYGSSQPLSEPLARYLAEDEPTRTDITDTAHIIAASHPSSLLSGRWPTSAHKHQSLMQQVAINAILGETLPIFSVNGPPGTGKTTLLRDVIADVICRRAKAMTKFDWPDKAFKEVGRITNEKEPNRPTIIYEPDESLVGFEMVVASSNNAAVKNVSNELPLADAVDGEYGAGYLHETATHVFAKPAWGLLSAVLGKRQNVVDFAERLLFADGDNRDARLHSVLGKRSQNVWAQARLKFAKAQEELVTIISCRVRWCHALEVLDREQRKLEEVQQRRADLYVSLQRARSIVLKTQRERDIDAIQEEQKRLALVGVKAGRPRWLILALGLVWTHPTLRAYRVEIAMAGEAHMTAARRSARSLRVAINADLEKQSATQAFTDSEARVRRTAAAVRTHAEECANASDELREAFPDAQWRTQKLADRELTALWTDEVLNRSRTALLLAALYVHETFLGRANAELNLAHGNLMAWKLDCQGRQQGLTDRERQAVWRTLFLIVPVVSTTFASVGSLFRHLPSNFFGWAFIDEAGQAVPQSAVGLLWRARHAVVVGDPLQVPPVVTTPASLIVALARHLGAPLEWAALETTSVQTVADRGNPLGAYVDISGSSPIWVGSPLHVHRRCEEPMFSISNRIAYGGAMVLATKKRELLNIAELGPSRWIRNSGAVTSGKHIVDAQADAVVRLMQRYWSKEAKEPAPQGPPLYVISPFRDIVTDTRKVLRARWNEWTSSQEQAREWVAANVGTIHTFQGRETDAVILLLGCDRNSQGAVRWASATPNLLNVAASRARSRFYVIGDPTLWGASKFFKIAIDEFVDFAKGNSVEVP